MKETSLQCLLCKQKTSLNYVKFIFTDFSVADWWQMKENDINSETELKASLKKEEDQFQL